MSVFTWLIQLLWRLGRRGKRSADDEERTACMLLFAFIALTASRSGEA